MASSDSEPKYVISVTARIVGIETHTLRYYERLGLVQPYRSEGNIRYYSESDVEQLRYTKTLMCDLGVNPAGVEVIMHITKKMVEMNLQISELTSEVEKLRQAQQGKKEGMKKGSLK